MSAEKELGYDEKMQAANRVAMAQPADAFWDLVDQEVAKLQQAGTELVEPVNRN